jgi:MFS family permease
MFANFTPVFQGSFPVLLLPLQAGLGCSRTVLTIGYGIAMACLSVGGLLTGRWVDKYGYRAVLMIAIPALGATLALFSVMPASAPVVSG